MSRSKPPQPRGESSARTPAPAQSPGKSSIRAILRHLIRGLRAFAAGAIVLWIWVVDVAIWCLLWIWKNPWRSTKTAVSVFFRIATLLSVSYLVYDRVYEIEATISSPVPNTQHPFVFVFTITNNSHLFRIRHVHWDCITDHLKIDHGHDFNMAQIINGSESEIQPGQSLNINCNTITGAGTAIVLPPNAVIAEAVMRIKIVYDTDVLWIFTSRRSPPPTKFTWFTEGATPQWVKGNFAR
jgi:hypothetical protein